MMLMLLLDVGCVLLQKGLGRFFGVSFRFGRGLVLGLVGGGEGICVAGGLGVSV